MQQLKILFVLSVLLLSGANTEDTTPLPWNGDPALCTVPSAAPPPPQKPIPIFDLKAEFSLEIDRELYVGGAKVRQITKEQHLFDYNANKAIVVTNANNAVTSVVYDYNKKYQYQYTAATFCDVKPVDANIVLDGRSAYILPNGSYHLRHLDGYLLFAYYQQDGNKINPTYVSSTTHRGIKVDIWQSCYINQTEYSTVLRRWYLADSNVATDFGPVGNKAVPIYGDISISQTLPNGTELIRTDEFINVEFYKPGIVEGADVLSAPKGVLCVEPNQTNLVALEQLGIRWPTFFTVRVEATSSRSSRWERFHLSYASGRDAENPFVRYDYLPEGAEDFTTVIHDDLQMLTYTIDQRRGHCEITRRTDTQLFSPIRNPIEFFVKYAENFFLYPSKQQAWSLNAVRSCRGDGIECIIATSGLPGFPPKVDSDTGYWTGEDWSATTVEYSWARRALRAPLPPNATRIFDYPVSLYLRFYDSPSQFSPSTAGLRVEDIEYEFFDMGTDLNPYVFDISSCYRSRDFEYLHLYFTMQVDRDNVLDTGRFDRRNFQRSLTRHLAQTAQVSFIRISEIDFDQEVAGRKLNIFFTLLGQVYIPETRGFNDSEPTASQARKNLEDAINSRQFSLNLTSNGVFIASFTADAKSLAAASSFVSSAGDGSSSGNVESNTEYSAGSQALAILVGLLVGIVAGAVGAAIIHKLRGGSIPSPVSLSNPRQSVGFTNSKSTAETSKA